MKARDNLHQLLLCIAVMCCLTAGCSNDTKFTAKGRYGLQSFPLVRTVPDPAAGTYGEVLQSDDEPFDFAFAAGGFEGGLDFYHLLQIDSTGKCEYRFPEEMSPAVFARKRALFQLEQDELRKLRQVLLENRFLELAEAYHTNFADGMHLWIKCDFGGKSKMVECHNHFPDETVNIHDYVRGELLARHNKEILDAQEAGGWSGLDEVFGLGRPRDTETSDLAPVENRRE
jgi:hypothetical protein